MMRIAFVAGLAAIALPAAAPAFGQAYFETITTARHGNGYIPAAIVAGKELETSFAVIAISADGVRAGVPVTETTPWRLTLTTGPRVIPEDDDDEEEDDRYLDKPKPEAAAKPAGPPVPRVVKVYSSRTCPAVIARMQALKPLATFEYDPPVMTGNKDGGKGDGHVGLDVWIRVGDAELNRSAERVDSKLGQWFDGSLTALKACPEQK